MSIDAPLESTDEQVIRTLQEMVQGRGYPCVGAKSAFNQGGAEVVVFDRLADATVTRDLLARLTTFLHAPGDDSSRFRSFVAAFRSPVPSSEEEFEQLLWRQLQLLTDMDDQEWDQTVSADPASPHYCFSIAGTAAFVIGMHPLASRLARRTPLPVLVFNPHAQFEALRVAGGYDRMRDIIRRRDTALQGTVNPMVVDHGQGSEARQYSGRAVGSDWQSPPQ